VGSKVERQTIFAYEAARLQAAANFAPIVPEPWSERDDAFKEQMIEFMGRYTAMDHDMTPEELHDSWWQAYIDLGWTYGLVRDQIEKTHPDMVPFDELGLEEQIKDEVFMYFCKIAKVSIW